MTTKPMTPKEIIAAFVAENQETQNSLWKQCELAMIAFTSNNAGEWGESGTWARDLGDAIGVERRAIYDRKNAFFMLLMMKSELGVSRTSKAAERGYSYFADVYHYRNDAALSDLSEAIDIASNKSELRIYLRGRYGDGETQQSFIETSYKKLYVILGMLETHHAPQDVRAAMASAVEAIEIWQSAVDRNG